MQIALSMGARLIYRAARTSNVLCGLKDYDVITPSRSLEQRAYEETKKFIVIAFYLRLIFSLMLLYKSVILEKPIGLLAHGFALINALALGKVILIGRAFHVGGRTTNEPLILPTLKKSALFSILLAIFKVLEEAAVGFFHGRSFQQSIAEIGGGTLKGILCLTFIIFVVLIPFFGYSELRDVLAAEPFYESQ